MLHLLPATQKKKVLGEYRKRLAIVACCFLSALAVIGCIILLPAYTSSHNRYVQIKNTKDAIDKNISALSQDKTAEVVTKINQYIVALGPLGSKDMPSEVIDKIISYKGSGIRLTHFTYTYQQDGSLKAVVMGVSKTRQDLTDFVKNLQSDSYFQGINVPLGSFTKEYDIDFSFPMTIKGKSLTATST